MQLPARYADAILAAGEPYEIKPVGTQAYFSTPLSKRLDGVPGAWHERGPQKPGATVFTG